VRPAIEFVFGRTFICDDKENAHRLSIDPLIKRQADKIVTLAGDVYTTRGTLSGGAKRAGAGWLEDINKYQEGLRVVNDHQQLVRTLDAERVRMRPALEERRRVAGELARAQAQLATAVGRLQATESQQMVVECERLETELIALERTIEEGEKREQELIARIDELKYKIDNADEYRKREMKTVRDELTRTRRALDDHKKMHEKNSDVLEHAR
jgi:structural maintenance of chromosome 2